MQEGNTGYIPISRKFFDHYLWTEDREFSKAEAWLDCIQLARYKKGKTKKFIGSNIIEWGYGQFPASVRFLKERWGWKSNSKVENFLSLLESDNMIKIEKGQGQNVITLCNYDSYDIGKNAKKTPKGHQEDTDKTGTGHRQDTGRTPRGRNSKKGNKGNKGKKGNNTNPIGDSGKVEIPTWGEFWKAAQMKSYHKEFARHIYDDLKSSGWRDHLGRVVHDWNSYLNKQHKYQQKWLMNNGTETKRDDTGEAETEYTRNSVAGFYETIDN